MSTPLIVVLVGGGLLIALIIAGLLAQRRAR